MNKEEASVDSIKRRRARPGTHIIPAGRNWAEAARQSSGSSLAACEPNVFSGDAASILFLFFALLGIKPVPKVLKRYSGS